MTIGTAAKSGVARMRRHVSKPSAPGSITSSTTTSKRPRRSAARPRSPSPATVTSISCRPRYSRTRSASRASSSTRSAAVRAGMSVPAMVSVHVAPGVGPDVVGARVGLHRRQHVVGLDHRLTDRIGDGTVLLFTLLHERLDRLWVEPVALEEREPLLEPHPALLPVGLDGGEGPVARLVDGGPLGRRDLRCVERVV